MSKTLEELNVGTYDNMHIVCIDLFIILINLFNFYLKIDSRRYNSY
jgi:hypothetical protein